MTFCSIHIDYEGEWWQHTSLSESTPGGNSCDLTPLTQTQISEQEYRIWQLIAGGRQRRTPERRPKLFSRYRINVEKQKFLGAKPFSRFLRFLPEKRNAKLLPMSKKQQKMTSVPSNTINGGIRLKPWGDTPGLWSWSRSRGVGVGRIFNLRSRSRRKF